jgi:hypothetical protein
MSEEILNLLGYIDVLIDSTEESVKNIKDNPVISKANDSQSLWLKKYVVELFFQKEIKKKLLILYYDRMFTDSEFNRKYYSNQNKITEVENIRRMFNNIKELKNE